MELDTAGRHWELALDAAGRAVDGAEHVLPHGCSAPLRRELAHERQEVGELLARLAHDLAIDPAPWLAPSPVTRALLGLPPETHACLFDLEGVLTDSGLVQARVWAVVFDEVLLRLAQQTGRQFVPFTAEEYRAYVERRSRLDGIRTFLATRGIHLPEGAAGEPPDAQTVFALAERKRALLARELATHGVAARAGAHQYLQAAGYAGLVRAAISASSTMSSMLELSRLSPLLEAHVDAGTPDVLGAACEALGVQPARAVTFTATPAGAAAGHAAGLVVVAVGPGVQGEEHAVESLIELLDPRLRSAAGFPQ